MNARTLALLRHRTQEATDELADLRESDPAAASAMHAIRLAERTLVDVWRPALEGRPDDERDRSGDSAA